MPRGQAIEAQSLGPAQQQVELHGTVALDAGIGRAAGRVLVDVGRDHGAVELLGQVEDVVRDAQLLGYPSGVLDVGHGATTRVGGPAPQLERGARDVMALLDQQRGRDGRVDAAGHRYEHPHGTSVPPGRHAARRSAATTPGTTRERAVHVGFGGAEPQREAQRARGEGGLDAHGGQHVAGLERTTGARRPAGDADALAAEGDEHLFAVAPGEAQVQVPRQDGDARRHRAVRAVDLPKRPSASRSRRAATRVAAASRSAVTSRSAVARPTAPATSWVPLRRSRS